MRFFKYLSISLVSLALILILIFPAAWVTGEIILKLDGATWYENGCIDGVAEAYLVSNSKFNLNNVTGACIEKSIYLRKHGHLK